MSDRHFDALNGDDANSGSITSKWKTFGGAAPAAFIAAMSGADRLILGTGAIFRPTIATLATWVGITASGGATIIPSSTTEKFKIQGCAQVPTGWSDQGGGRYRKNIGAGLSIGSILFGLNETFYMGGINSDVPLRMGLLVAGTYGSCASNEGAYDSASGNLEVNVGEDPLDGVYVTKDAGQALIIVGGGSSSLVEGFDLAVAGKLNAAKTTYCIQGQGCSGSIFQDGIAQMGTNHCAGFTSGLCTNNLFKNVVVAGGDNNATLFINHSASAGNTSGKLNGCVAHVMGHYGHHGQQNVANSAVAGYYAHCDSSVIADLEYRDCAAYGYGPSTEARGFAALGASTELATYTGSRYSNAGRALRYIGCTGVGLSYGHLNGAPLFQRCKFNFSQAGPSGAAVTFGAIRCNGSGGTGCPSLPLFESCEILTDLNNASSTIALFQARNTVVIQAGEGPTLVNCNVLEVSAGSNTPKLIDTQGNANFTCAATGSVFGATQSGRSIKLLGNDSGRSASLYPMSGNAYTGIGSTIYSDDASRNTFAEFVATVDETGVEVSNANAKFTGAQDSKPLPGSHLYRKQRSTIHTNHGINHQPYAGNAGAWQRPSIAKRLALIEDQQ